MKTFLIFLFVLFTSVCAWGGGAFIGIAICWLFNINGDIAGVITLFCTLFFSGLSFWLIEKFNKFF